MALSVPRWGLCAALGFLFASSGLLCACGASRPSAEDAARSERETNLAVTYYTEGSIPAAIERLRGAIALDPDNAPAHYLLGYLLLEASGAQHDPEGALEHLERAVELYEARGGVGGQLSEALNVYGLALMSAERCPEAVSILRRSASDATNREPFKAWFNLGLAHHCAGDSEAALEALRRSVGINPAWCFGHLRIGQLHFEREELSEAESALDRALALEQSCIAGFGQQVRRVRGEVRAHLGHAEEAIGDLERCVELGRDTQAGLDCQRLLEAVQ
ncbi:MAG: tetratricopeptide repeat protein [Myxococcales bacterium]|nr:tetratricopeptide repeat protein [Myxococcales bacterium]